MVIIIKFYVTILKQRFRISLVFLRHFSTALNNFELLMTKESTAVRHTEKSGVSISIGDATDMIPNINMLLRELRLYHKIYNIVV